MRTLILVLGLAALTGCTVNHLYFGNDSDARLTCKASLSFKHMRGVKLTCGSDLRPNDSLRSGAWDTHQRAGG